MSTRAEVATKKAFFAAPHGLSCHDVSTIYLTASVYSAYCQGDFVLRPHYEGFAIPAARRPLLAFGPVGHTEDVAILPSIFTFLHLLGLWHGSATTTPPPLHPPAFLADVKSVPTRWLRLPLSRGCRAPAL